MNTPHSFSQHARARRELEELQRHSRRVRWVERFTNLVVALMCGVVLGALCRLHFPERTAALRQELRTYFQSLAVP